MRTIHLKYILLLSFLLFSKIQLKAQVVADAGFDKELCINDSLVVEGKGLSSSDTGTYQWKDLSNNSIISNNRFLKLKTIVVGSKLFELKVTKTKNTITYTDYDTFELITNSLPQFSGFSIGFVCFNDGPINLTSSSGLVTKVGVGNSTIVSNDSVRFFQYKNPSWVSGGPPYIYNFTNATIPFIGLNDSIWFEYTDLKGCYNKGSKKIKLYPNPPAELKTNTFCQKTGLITLDNLIVKPIASDRIGAIQTFKCLKVPNGSGVDKDAVVWKDESVFPPFYVMDPGQVGENQKIGDYQIEYCLTNSITGCKTCDSIWINVARLPEIKFEQVSNFCESSDLIALDSFVYDSLTKKRFVNGFWEIIEYNGSRNVSNIKNGVSNGRFFNSLPSLKSGSYLFKFTDISSGCDVSDSILIQYDTFVNIIFQVPDTIYSNQDSVLFLSNFRDKKDINWFGEAIRKDGMLFLNQINFENQKSIKRGYLFCYTNPNNLCVSCDTLVVVFVDSSSNSANNRVVNLNAINTYPNPIKDVLSIENQEFECFSIFDCNGKVILKNAINLNSNIDFSAYSKGVYFIELKDSQSIRWIKVVKE